MMRHVAIATLLVLSLSATTVEPMSIERLTEASTHVLLGHAQNSWVEWNRDQTLIFTITRFEVERAIKGAAEPTILVKQLGGTLGGIQQKVSGIRQFSRGEEAVLFLHPSEDRLGAYAISGLFQGNFKVLRAGGEVMVSNGVPDVKSFNRVTHATSEFRGPRLTLLELETRVRRAVER